MYRLFILTPSYSFLARRRGLPKGSLCQLPLHGVPSKHEMQQKLPGWPSWLATHGQLARAHAANGRGPPASASSAGAVALGGFGSAWTTHSSPSRWRHARPGAVWEPRQVMQQ